MKKGLKWGAGLASPGPVAAQRVDHAPIVRKTQVADDAIYAAMGAMAAVIEEPYCMVGPRELRQLVHAVGRLSRAMGDGQSDYVMREGRACYTRTGEVCKAPLAEATYQLAKPKRVNAPSVGKA